METWADLIQSIDIFYKSMLWKIPNFIYISFE